MVAVAVDKTVAPQPGASASDAPKLVLAPTDLASIVKVNEARAANDLPNIPGGDITIVEYRAQHAQAIATVSDAEGSGASNGDLPA